MQDKYAGSICRLKSAGQNNANSICQLNIPVKYGGGICQLNMPVEHAGENNAK